MPNNGQKDEECDATGDAMKYRSLAHKKLANKPNLPANFSHFCGTA
ncbi:MAG: hypothetical protein WDN26_12585 [Chitinophagaceae bacterium]